MAASMAASWVAKNALRATGGYGHPTPPAGAIKDIQEGFMDRLLEGDLQWWAEQAVEGCRHAYKASRDPLFLQKLSTTDPSFVECLQPPQLCIVISKHGQCKEYDHLVMVAYRGNDTGSNWAQSFDWAAVPCELPGLGGHVHKGWLESSASIQELVNGKVQDCLDRLPGRKLVTFAGHSSGGSMAALAAARFHPSKPADVDVSVITLGSPRFGDDKFAQSFVRLVPQTLQLATSGDLVPLMPPLRSWTHLCCPLVLDSTGSEVEQHKVPKYLAALQLKQKQISSPVSAASRDRSRSPRR